MTEKERLYTIELGERYLEANKASLRIAKLGLEEAQRAGSEAQADIEHFRPAVARLTAEADRLRTRLDELRAQAPCEASEEGKDGGD